MLAASGIMLSELAACTPGYNVIKSDILNDTVLLPVSSFSQSAFQFIRPKGWNYDIAVQKKGDQYEALLMQCTHQHNQLIPTGSGFTCTLHGSQFNKEGNVTKGPAEMPLRKFNTAIDRDQVVIKLKA